jgi:hypothetical protein
MMSITLANPEEILLQGSELLKPIFSKHGFIFAVSGTGNSSGGQFASAEFTRGERRFELHFRFSLGMVAYHLGSKSISHEEYMCSVLGKPYLSKYPGFSDDPLDAFCDLRQDLETHCSEFLEGTNDAFLHRIEDGRIRWANRQKLPG